VQHTSRQAHGQYYYWPSQHARTIYQVNTCKGTWSSTPRHTDSETETRIPRRRRRRRRRVRWPTAALRKDAGLALLDAVGVVRLGGGRGIGA